MYAKYIKRILDFLLSLSAILILSPVLLILTVVGAVKMKGNPFFVQPRPGKINRKTGKEKIFNLKNNTEDIDIYYFLYDFDDNYMPFYRERLIKNNNK